MIIETSRDENLKGVKPSWSKIQHKTIISILLLYVAIFAYIVIACATTISAPIDGFSANIAGMKTKLRNKVHSK